jgi:citrate synthase
VWDTLKSGKVVPGFGHAVLRKTDPRYTCQVSITETLCAEVQTPPLSWEPGFWHAVLRKADPCHCARSASHNVNLSLSEGKLKGGLASL